MPKCKGRKANGAIKKGYRVKKGKSCPVKVGKRSQSSTAKRARRGGRVTEMHCKGIVQTGKKRGKLKKGFKFVPGKKCPVKSRRKR